MAMIRPKGKAFKIAQQVVPYLKDKTVVKSKVIPFNEGHMSETEIWATQDIDNKNFKKPSKKLAKY